MTGGPSAWQRGLDVAVQSRAAEAISRCERLPVLDRAVQRVLAITDDEESATGDLVAALEADPALAANILRFANSAYAGRPIRAKTVRQAVTMAGRKATRQLCLEAVTFRFFEAAPGNGHASRGQLHIHSVSVANVAAAAAALVGISPELPHLAGLLHDCGKLVMPLAFGEAATNAIADAHPCGVQRSAAEWEQFGIDHAYAGALFAIQSGLDRDVVDAVAWHHGGRRGCVAPTPEVACVQLADTVVWMLAGASPDTTLLDETLASLGLGPDALDVLAERVTESSTGSAGLANRVEHLERLASTDELTGLANRRHWMNSVRARVQDGEAGDVLLCDLDYFKDINDTHGHSTGDLVLTEIARILSLYGTAGRIGGDEFAVWLPEGALHSAAAAGQIVTEVASAFPDHDRLSVSVSIGVAPAGDDLADALERADRALYAAKAAGRGQACHANPELPQVA
jgi:diguanylate cyclase (GGDEF)-like protein/putative nucleotidyltransferase with HDIG domain